MITKTNKLLIGLALISFATASFAFGPPPCGGRGGPGGQGQSSSFNPEDRMANELNLNDEQKKQMKSIMLEQRTEARQWRKEHQQKMQTKLSKVFTAEQLEQFKDLQEQRMERKGRNF